MSDVERLEPQDGGVEYELSIRLSAADSEVLDKVMEREGVGLSEAVAFALRVYARAAAREDVRQLPARWRTLTRGEAARHEAPPRRRAVPRAGHLPGG